jgi:hypothetical protein
MKRIVLFFLVLSSPVFADIAVTPGVGKTVATQTNNSREYQGVVVADPGGVSTMTVTSGGAALVTSSGMPVTFTGIAQPVNLQNGVSVDSAAFTLGLTSITISGGVFIPNPIAIINTSTTTAVSRINRFRSQYVTLMDDNNVILGTSTTNPIIVQTSGTVNVTTAPIFGEASSTTIPSPVADNSIDEIMLDAQGRIVTSDISWELTTSTWSTTEAQQASNDLVLVSSATAPKRTFLCGCSFKNNSATNTAFTIYQSSSAATNPFYPIPVPANSGWAIRSDCGHPFFASIAGGELTIKPDAVATSVSMWCNYIQR